MVKSKPLNVGFRQTLHAVTREILVVPVLLESVDIIMQSCLDPSCDLS